MDIPWLSSVAEAHAAGVARWEVDALVVSRQAGGHNNALDLVDVAGQSYACKLCVADERERARREYGALRLLEKAGLDLAPQPVALDESCAVLPFPVAVYRWLSGDSIGPSLNEPELVALLDGYCRMHSLWQADSQEADLLEAWFHWFDYEVYLSELHGFMAQYGAWLATTGPDGQDLSSRLGRLVERCTGALRNSGVEPGRDRVPRCLCRVDPNLRNAIWCTDDRLRWVDWEYSGWGDPALDLAELRWHAALMNLDERQHSWLRDNYPRPLHDPQFDARLAVWDQLLAARWPFLTLRALWSCHNGPHRLRLTSPELDPLELRRRTVSLIERAELHLL
jgi:hypothetical protein